MASTDFKKLSIQEKGLRYKLLIIEALVFVMPFLILSYVFYKSNVFLEKSHLFIFALILVLILAGLVILRQIFDRFLTVTNLVRKAVGVDEHFEEIRKDAGELHEITASFESLMNKFEKTTSELQRRVFELFALKELTEFASKVLDVDVLLNGLLEKAIGVSRAQIGSVFMVESEKQRFRVAASKGLKSGPKKDSYINVDESLARSVVSDKEPLLVQNIETDTRTNKPNDPKYGSPSFLSMPLLIKEDLVAVLNLASKETGQTFDENDKEILSIMIGEINFALENARLHSKIEDHLKDLQRRTEELTIANDTLQQEIRERRKFGKALRKSEERFRTVVEDMPALICRFLPDGKLIFVSRSFCKYLNRKRGDLIGRNFFEFIPKEDRERIRNQFISLYKEKPLTTYEHQIIAPDGISRWQQWTGRALLDKQGRVVGYQSLGRDITDRKRTEEEKKKLEAQLLQAQKLEAIGTLAGGIAHDFNNLLMGIQGNASLMLLGTDQGHPHFEKLKKIERYVQSGAELTKQILGFARGGKYEVKSINLNDVLKRTSGMLDRTKKEIKVHRDYQKDIRIVEADKGQIEQVLLNLYVNAWQAMPGGGDLYLRTENVDLDEADVKPFDGKPGKYVKLSFRDTGVGMDETTRQKIFDPFFTTKGIGRGTGLGLASAYGIIKSHGGIINVQSKKGKGTKFDIYLPASEKKAMEEEKPSEKILKGEGTILLVDDEDMIVDVGEEILMSLGYKVLSAKGGIEAIKTCEKSKDKIDMVILDMIMPDMGGGETYDNLKKIRPDIKILLSSGYSINGEATRILERGCDGFIQKPFNANDLSRKVKEILGRKK